MPRVLKPAPLATLHRVVEFQRQAHAVVCTLAYFPLTAPRRLLPEAAMWPVAAELLGPMTLEECLPKPRGEALVAGHCYSPGGARPSSYVRLRVGTIDKTLAVVGDRTWNDAVPTPPLPFESMPLTWDRAFGGPVFAANPLGKGFAAVDGRHALPNLEDPNQLLRAPGQRPRPVTFGPIDPGWPQRFSKLGTYDEAWLKESFPGYARDLDASCFNVAQPDQWIDGAFAGGEAFSLENMHPTKPVIDGTLPRHRARTFLTRVGSPDGFEEVTMRLDTVWFFPEIERGVLVFRGLVPVAEDDASDIENLLIAAEDLDAPRAVAHYRRELDLRLDRRRGAIHALRDAPLLPTLDVGGPPLAEETSESKEQLKTEGLHLAKAQRGLQANLGKAREQVAEALRAQGLDPAAHMPPAPTIAPLPSADDLEAMIARMEKEEAEADVAQAEAEKSRAEMEASARKTCEDLGLDYDALAAEGKRQAAGPPKFSAEAEWRKLQALCVRARADGAVLTELETKLADPKFYAQLQAHEAALLRLYRQGAHLAPSAGPRKDGDGALLRQSLLEAHALGATLGGEDFTGADLSGLDLRNAKLAGAFLEATNLSGADLRGADLTDAVVAHANLRDARLEGCNLTRANFGATNLTSTRLDGCEASHAIFTRARMIGTSLRGAKLAGADLSEVVIERVDLEGASAPGILLHKVPLRGVSFRGATLTKANFIELDASGVDFTGADLTLVSFVAVDASRAIFREARMEKFHAVRGSTFRAATFERARLEGAFLRGSSMAGCNFGAAVLDDADLGECDLQGASFHRAVARRALFVRANLSQADLTAMNLMEGSLSKAVLHGAKLLDLNLFRADLSKIRVDTATKLDGCLMTSARIYPKAADGPR